MKVWIRYDWHERAWDVVSGERLEYVELEAAGFSVGLECIGNLYLVSSYSERTTNFSVTDNKDEAVQSFKEELAYLVYETPGVDDETEQIKAEQALEKHGFLDDMKNAYRILEDNGGRVLMASYIRTVSGSFSGTASHDELGNLLKSKYPSFNPELVRLALSALWHKNYIRPDVEDNASYYSITKKLDF